MEKMRFCKSEVISYLEELIKCGASNEEQEELYINYKWTNKLVKDYTYKQVIKMMRREYEGF